MIPTFYAQLSRAISELAKKGYYGEDQVESWQRLLRAAAMRHLGTEHDMRIKTRYALSGVYRRLVDKAQVLKAVPRATRYTISACGGELYAELNRRIMAANDLVQAARIGAVDSMLRRFTGWATSIPVGGSSAVDQLATRSMLTRSLQKARSEHQQIIVDQRHKLEVGLTSIVARQGEAIAGVWHSHWRDPGYDYRPDHKDRDERIYFVRDSWAVKEGLIRRSCDYIDEQTMPGEEIHCRCLYHYVTSLNEIPDHLLTRKGQELALNGG